MPVHGACSATVLLPGEFANSEITRAEHEVVSNRFGTCQRYCLVVHQRCEVGRSAGSSALGGAPKGKRSGNYRHGARSKETIELWKLIKSLRRQQDVNGHNQCLRSGVKRMGLTSQCLRTSGPKMPHRKAELPECNAVEDYGS